MLPAQCLVLGSIGMKLCAIKRDFSQLKNIHLPCNLQNLNEDQLNLSKKAFPE